MLNQFFGISKNILRQIEFQKKKPVFSWKNKFVDLLILTYQREYTMW